MDQQPMTTEVELDSFSQTAATVYEKSPQLSKKLLFLFAFTCFAVVGNLYYAQPLLVDIGYDFYTPLCFIYKYTF